MNDNPTRIMRDDDRSPRGGGHEPHHYEPPEQRRHLKWLIGIMVAVIAGLVIAIPAMAFYAWFRRSAARQVAHLECACSDLLTAILTQRVK